MAYLAVSESGLVLVMGKRNIAPAAAVYADIFCAFILGGHGTGGHGARCYGGDRYDYYQKFKSHIGSTPGIRFCFETQINPTIINRIPPVLI
jgi:hypothetical protein